MNCPKCGTQNPDDIQVCNSCGSDLTQPSEATESVNVKTSRLAITTLVLGILIPLVFFLAVMFKSFVLAITCMAATILAVILGIIGLVQIAISAGRITGKGFAAIGIAIPVVLFSMIFLAALFLYRPPTAYRMVCGSNLSGIGRAMLIYANDWDNCFPRAGGTDTIWQTKLNNWQADNRIDAFGLRPDGTGGSATISSSLYLLVKYAEVMPKSFICNKDTKSTEFKPAKYGARRKKLTDFWDFGPNPTKHCSYSYHMCYGPYPLNTTSSDAGMAVAADRNPWLDPYTDTTGFRWDDKTKTGGRENIRRYQKGNSGLHQREGQNVLFVDTHVYFEKQPFCGVNQDNIYTYWNGSDVRQGAPPTLKSQPADRLDSLLVNDPPKAAQK